MSTDTPEAIKAARHKHGLQARMLPDPELRVIDLFGLRNMGIYSGPPGKVAALPVPTSLLIDKHGVVVWMDQSENYQQRSEPDHVRAALRENLN